MLFEMCDVWTYVGQVGKNLYQKKIIFWFLHVHGNLEVIVVYGGDREMVWYEVMVQRVKNAEKTVGLELGLVEIKDG